MEIMVMDSYLDNYVGEWEDETGNRLSIRKIDDETCVVSFFRARDHQPIRRPWYAGKLSVDMVAKYRPKDGPELIVELGEEGSGFTLYLNFETAYSLDAAERNALVPAVSRNAEDDFLEQYYRYFEPLKHYTTRTAPGAQSPRGGKR
jgi:hypothetical protein